MTTTPSGTITAPTRRELLMSLGTLAIGIATGAARIGSPLRLADLVGRRHWWPKLSGRRDISASGRLARQADRGARSWLQYALDRDTSDNPGRSERASHAQRNRQRNSFDGSAGCRRSGAPGKGNCALQGADGQPNEIPAVACGGHAGRRLLSGHGPVRPRAG